MSNAPTPRIIALLLAISSLPIMANATISPSLPGLAQAFSDTPNIETLAGLVLALPSVAIVLTAALFGSLLDRVSWKPVLYGALVFYALGGAAGALMDGMTGLLVSRFALGLGVAAAMTTVSMLAAQLFEGEARNRFMGWQAAAMSAGGIVFILTGGLLAEITWRAPFLTYLLALPFVVLALAMFRPLPARFVSATPDARARAPIPTLALTGGLGFLTMAIFYLVPTKLPFHMAELGITAPSTVALAVAGVTMTSAPGALLFGRLRARLSAAAIFALSYGIMGVGYMVVATADATPQILLGTLIAGLGLGPSMPNIMSVLMARTPPEARGKAAGFATTCFFAGQFAAPIFAGVVAGPFGLSVTFAVFGVVLFALAATALARMLVRAPAPAA
jgi:MFS family permease